MWRMTGLDLAERLRLTLSSTCLKRAAGLAALHNLLVWAGMVQDRPVPIESSFVLNFDEPHRYLVYPSVTKTGSECLPCFASLPIGAGE
jgi:hypothetical protein